MPSQSISIFAPSALYVAATTQRGIRPATSPGPYTVAGRSTTSGRPAAVRAASSARAHARAGSVHGSTRAPSPAPSALPLLSGLYTNADDTWMKRFTGAPAAAAATAAAAALPAHATPLS